MCVYKTQFDSNVPNLVQSLNLEEIRNHVHMIKGCIQLENSNLVSLSNLNVFVVPENCFLNIISISFNFSNRNPHVYNLLR